MGYLHVSVLLVILGTVSAASIARRETEDPLVATFFSLSGDEKENFLSYFLNVGVTNKTTISLPGKRKDIIQLPVGLNIPQDQIQKFQSMNIPDSSVNKLVTWTKSRFALEDSGIAKLAMKKEVCNAAGQCITVPDVGTLCCPW